MLLTTVSQDPLSKLTFYENYERLPSNLMNILINALKTRFSLAEIQQEVLNKFRLSPDVCGGFIYITETKPGLFFFLFKVNDNGSYVRLFLINNYLEGVSLRGSADNKLVHSTFPNSKTTIPVESDKNNA